MRRLRRVGLDEVRVRARQYAAMLWDRTGVSERVRVPANERMRARTHSDRDDDDWVAAVRDAVSSGWPIEVGLKQLRAEWLDRFGTRERELVAQATEVLAGRFDLLGHRALSFGEPIDWSLDPTTGVRAPARHWSRIRYLDAAVAGDKKVIWELNRHQHLLTLARAYVVTADDRWAAGIGRHLDAWMRANPPGHGINWASSLEVAFRSISWLWSLRLCASSMALDDGVLARAAKCLWLHGRHIETYLSTYFSPNTHLSGEALGLLYLGRLLPFEDSARWKEVGERVLLHCLDRQVLRDGVHFERSMHYHHYTVEIYTHAWLLGSAALRERIGARLPAMLDVLMAVQRPDGCTPMIGDDDGGRLFQSGGPAGNDFRAALSTGAALFERGDYKHASGEMAEETLWLLGPSGAATFDELEKDEPSAGSAALPRGGYYVMRDGWSRDANYMIVDCGEHGALSCGHAHADGLAVEIAADGEPIIIDPGTCVYTASAERRDQFRTTQAHATLTVDDAGASTPGGPFSWRRVTDCTPRHWYSGPRLDYIEGEHDGYTVLEAGLRHRRAVLFVKGGYWLIRDRVLGARRAHDYAATFPCAAGVTVEEGTGSERLVLRANDAALTLVALGPGAWRVETAAVSPVYGRLEPAPRVRRVWRGEMDQDVAFIALPGAASRSSIVPVAGQGGAGVRVELPNGDVDLLAWGAGSRIDVERVTTDASLLWMRFDGAGAPRELFAAGATRVDLDGVSVLRGHDAERPIYMRLDEPGMSEVDIQCAESAV